MQAAFVCPFNTLFQIVDRTFYFLLTIAVVDLLLYLDDDVTHDSVILIYSQIRLAFLTDPDKSTVLRILLMQQVCDFYT